MIKLMLSLEELLSICEKPLDILVNSVDRIDFSTKEDFKQEVRISIIEEYKKKEDVLSDIDDIKGYFFKLMKNKILDLLKSKQYKIRDHLSLNEKVDDESGAEFIDIIDAYIDVYEDDSIFELINTKFDDLRYEIICLRYKDDLTFVEIGKRLNISKDKSKRYHDEVILKLRKEVMKFEKQKWS